MSDVACECVARGVIGTSRWRSYQQHPTGTRTRTRGTIKHEFLEFEIDVRCEFLSRVTCPGYVDRPARTNVGCGRIHNPGYTVLTHHDPPAYPNQRFENCGVIVCVMPEYLSRFRAAAASSAGHKSYQDIFNPRIYSFLDFETNYPWKIEYFLEDLFLGGQWSIILGYRRLSVKSLLVCGQAQLESF